MVIELPTGWLTEQEARALQELARDKLVLEIGSFLGRSTVALARVARHVVSVDHHRGSPEILASLDRPDFVGSDNLINPETGEFDTLPVFLNNLTRHGVRALVTVVVGSSGDVGQLLRDDAFDVVFVDGNHSMDSVMADGRLALRVVRPAGVVAFHDYDWDSVKTGIQALQLGRPQALAGSVAVFGV